MEFRRRTADTDPYYEAARALYQDSFPRPLTQQEYDDFAAYMQNTVMAQ